MAGAKRHAEPAIAGGYDVTAGQSCLGGAIELKGGGSSLRVERDGRQIGLATYSAGKLSGRVACKRATATLAGEATNRQIALTIDHPPQGESPGDERTTATKTRTLESTLAAFFLAIAAVMLAARLTGTLFTRIGQP